MSKEGGEGRGVRVVCACVALEFTVTSFLACVYCVFMGIKFIQVISTPLFACESY